MRKLIGALVMTGGLMVMAAGPAALAADGGGGSGLITATITAGAIGSRSVTSVAPVVMTSLLNAPELTASYAVLVTETARTGTNPWSVTATLAGALSDGLGHSIATTNMAVSARSVLKVLGGGTESAPTGSEDLSAARTLFALTGQDPLSVYTGTYTGSGTLTLTVPNAQAVGVYTGTLTVTLVQ
ncbi:MAG: hypothetical protein WDA71_10230 [Actinomycetota bacterium]